MIMMDSLHSAVSQDCKNVCKIWWGSNLNPDLRKTAAGKKKQTKKTIVSLNNSTSPQLWASTFLSPADDGKEFWSGH